MPHHPSKPSFRLAVTLASAFGLATLTAAARPPQDPGQAPAAPNGPGQFPARTQGPVTAKDTEAAKDKDKDAPPTEAELLLDEAIAKVKALDAVEADITQQVSMLGQDFQVKGNYLKGPGYQFRMELNLVGLSDVDGTMLQLCDGAVLWDYQKILNSQSYSRLGVGRILKRLEAPEFDDTIRERVVGQFNFAGPDALLTGLRKSVGFDQKEEDTLNGKDVWVIRGVWKDRSVLSNPGQAAPNGAIPPYIPTVVALTIGREDGWPYKVELRGRSRPMSGLGAAGKTPAATPKTGGVRQEMVSTVVLTYTNVRLNPTIDPARFAFQVSDPRTPISDQTEDYLAALERASQVAKQTPRTSSDDAPPAAGRPLDQPINVPKP